MVETPARSSPRLEAPVRVTLISSERALHWSRLTGLLASAANSRKRHVWKAPESLWS